MFFAGLSQRVLMRGGHVEDVVRYTSGQALQWLIDALEKASGLSRSRQSRSVLLYFTGVFNELIMAIFRGLFSRSGSARWEAQQAELRETSTPITEIWDACSRCLSSERSIRAAHAGHGGIAEPYREGPRQGGGDGSYRGEEH